MLMRHYCSIDFRRSSAWIFVENTLARPEMVVGKVPLILGHKLERADVENGRVRLLLRSQDGTQRNILTDHVIAATGYKVQVERLQFLNKEIRSSLKTVHSTPVLSSGFESSIPGLYFVGIAATNSFGPLMRFAYGADFAARHLARTLAKVLERNPASAAASIPVTTAK
jgi:thioredoxin reductase